MAEDFMFTTLDLFQKPQVVSVALAAKMTPFEAGGLIQGLWIWLIRHADPETGEILASSSILPGAVGGTADFWAAVKATGWLVEAEGYLRVPCWDRWLKRTAIALHADALRKRASRRTESTSGKRPEVVRETSANRPAITSETSVQMEMEMEMEMNTQSIPPTPLGGARAGGAPDTVDWPAVVERWNALAAAHGLGTIRKVPEKVRRKYRTALRETPDFWARLEAVLTTKTSAEFKASGYLTFEFTTRAGKLDEFEQGKYQKAFRDPGARGRKPPGQEDEYAEVIRKIDERKAWEESLGDDLEAEGREAF